MCKDKVFPPPHSHFYVATKHFFFTPNNMSRMCWLHQKNFKQLTVSPLRPHPSLSMCGCTETHIHLTITKRSTSLSRFVFVDCSSNLPLSPSLFVDLRMDVSPSKLDYCSQCCLAWISLCLGVIPHGRLTQGVIT